MPHNPEQQRPEVRQFSGFEPLTANYVYCPNQFFDVCLPNCSRGTTRIVAYIIRQTLGWLDEEGNPRQQEITVTYRDLIVKAGVSRGAIGPALQEAVESNLLVCRQNGHAHTAGKVSQSAAFALRWDEVGQYTNQTNTFAGFYVGEGHRTPIPNAYFDDIVCRESLAVVKVVGTVLRHTVGYQNQFGGRRSSAPLSFSYIAQYAHLSRGRVLSQAVQQAMSDGYIELVNAGRFGPRMADRAAAHYRVRWQLDAEKNKDGSIRPSASMVQNERFKNTTSNSSKEPSAQRFKKATKEKTVINNTNKQQTVAAEKGIQLLIRVGMVWRTSEQLMAAHGFDCVQAQVNWLEARKPANPVGMLRKAIEENWTKPRELEAKEQRQKLRCQQRQLTAEEQQSEQVIQQQKQQRRLRRERLLREWGSASVAERERFIRAAVERETSTRIADIIRRQPIETAKPPVQILDAVAAERNLPMCQISC